MMRKFPELKKRINKSRGIYNPFELKVILGVTEKSLNRALEDVYEIDDLLEARRNPGELLEKDSKLVEEYNELVPKYNAKVLIPEDQLPPSSVKEKRKYHSRMMKIKRDIDGIRQLRKDAEDRNYRGYIARRLKRYQSHISGDYLTEYKRDREKILKAASESPELKQLISDLDFKLTELSTLENRIFSNLEVYLLLPESIQKKFDKVKIEEQR